MLVVLVALAVTSFFKHRLTALTVPVAIPVGRVLRAFMARATPCSRSRYWPVFATVIQTITDTLRLMREAKRTTRKRPQTRAQRRAADRSRIAA